MALELNGDGVSKCPGKPPFPDGFRHIPGYLDGAAQRALMDAIAAIVAAAPLYRPTMPRTGECFAQPVGVTPVDERRPR